MSEEELELKEEIAETWKDWVLILKTVLVATLFIFISLIIGSFV